jgi:hypothetical protein
VAKVRLIRVDPADLRYSLTPPGTVCGYVSAPCLGDEWRDDATRPRPRPTPCDRPAAVRCRLHGLGPIDLCGICYEQMRCDREPHWWEVLGKLKGGGQ